MLRHMQRWKWVAAAIATAVLVAGTADLASATGTAAGVTISNSATVNYSVNAVAQPAITSATADFVVDRKIDLTLTAPGTYVNVTPGTANNAIPFVLTNTSNAPLNFALAGANNPTDPYGGTDNFNPTTIAVFVDANANGTYEPATDTATTVDTLAADASIRVFVVSTIPGGQANGSIAALTMTATAHETTANGGGALSQSAGADVAATVQTVFADGAGATDAARDAAFSATGAFLVQGANVTVTKTEAVISDPINGAVNPKHIPGAIVEYTVTVANAASSAVAATTITVTDVMPANVTFQPNTYGAGDGIQVGGVAKTNASDADEGTFGAGTVTVTIPSLAPGASSVIKFQVAVN
jgi:uncharacterized repeat protein (TIGR01451 family)